MTTYSQIEDFAMIFLDINLFLLCRPLHSRSVLISLPIIITLLFIRGQRTDLTMIDQELKLSGYKGNYRRICIKGHDSSLNLMRHICATFNYCYDHYEFVS